MNVGFWDKQPSAFSEAEFADVRPPHLSLFSFSILTARRRPVLTSAAGSFPSPDSRRLSFLPCRRLGVRRLYWLAPRKTHCFHPGRRRATRADVSDENIRDFKRVRWKASLCDEHVSRPHLRLRQVQIVSRRSGRVNVVKPYHPCGEKNPHFGSDQFEGGGST